MPVILSTFLRCDPTPVLLASLVSTSGYTQDDRTDGWTLLLFMIQGQEIFVTK